MDINVKTLAVPRVADAILSNYDITLLYGWRDGGKSTSAFNVLLVKCLFDSHFRWALCRAKYNEVAGSIFQTICDQIQVLKLEKYFIIKHDRFQIINKNNTNNYFFGASADQPDKIRSVPKLNGVLAEEAHDFKESDFASLLGTTRNIKGQKTKPKFIFIFNNDKVKKGSFLVENFFNPKSAMYDRCERVLISYEDNPYIDQEATTQKLKDVCLGNLALFNSLKAGNFLVEKAKRPFFNAISSHNFRNTYYNPSDIIWLSWDFNINASCLVAQFYSQLEILNATRPLWYEFKRGDTGGVYILEEFQANSVGSDAFMAMVRSIINKYPNHYYMITGDASGISNTTGKINSFKLIENALFMHGLTEHNFEIVGVSHGNARHTLSHTVVNTLISHYQENFIIDSEKCPQLTEDVNSIEIGSNGKIDKSYENTDSKGLSGHLADALRYLMINADWDTYKRLSEMTTPLHLNKN